MERITKEDQEDNIFSPRTSDISAAFDLTAKVLYLYFTIYSVYIIYIVLRYELKVILSFMF